MVVLSFNLLVTLFVIFLTVIFSIYLFTKRVHRKLYNVILALYLFSFGLVSLDVLLYENEFYYSFPEFANILRPLIFLLPVFPYFYVRSMIFKNKGVSLVDLLHFTPFLIYFVWLIIEYHISLTHEEKRIYLSTMDKSPPVLGFVIYSISIYYYIVQFKHIKLYRILLKQNYSEAKRIASKWLIQFVLSVFVLVIIAFIIWIISLILRINEPEFLNSFMRLVLLVFVVWIIYKALSVPQMFQGLDFRIVVENSKIILDKDELLIKSQIAALTDYFSDKQPYLDPSLSLHELSLQLEIPRRELSSLINDTYDKNFFDFINTYRIEHAKKMLSNKEFDDLTILEIMFDSGFNSKSSFHLFFKRYTGLTPIQYRKKYKVN